MSLRLGFVRDFESTSENVSGSGWATFISIHGRRVSVHLKTIDGNVGVSLSPYKEMRDESGNELIYRYDYIWKCRCAFEDIQVNESLSD